MVIKNIYIKKKKRLFLISSTIFILTLSTCSMNHGIEVVITSCSQTTVINCLLSIGRYFEAKLSYPFQKDHLQRRYHFLRRKQPQVRPIKHSLQKIL